MPEFVIAYRGTVYPWQCDHMGHMNVMWYTGKFDEASWQLLSKVGLTPSRLTRSRTAMAAVGQHIEYKRELHAGDDRSSNAEKRGCGDGGDRETRFFKHRDAIFESGGGSDWGFKSDDRRAGNASRMPSTAVEALLILTSCSREV